MTKAGNTARYRQKPGDKYDERARCSEQGGRQLPEKLNRKDHVFVCSSLWQRWKGYYYYCCVLYVIIINTGGQRSGAFLPQHAELVRFSWPDRVKHTGLNCSPPPEVLLLLPAEVTSNNNAQQPSQTPQEPWRRAVLMQRHLQQRWCSLIDVNGPSWTLDERKTKWNLTFWVERKWSPN